MGFKEYSWIEDEEIEDEEEGRELELDVVGVVVQPANKNKLLNKINDFFFIINSPFKTL